MKPHQERLARPLDALWTLAVGGFLGLSAGAVLAAVLAFQTARSASVQARPDAEPYSDTRFAEHWPDYVAGAIANRLFATAGLVVLVLVALAVLTTLLRFVFARQPGGSAVAWALRLLGVAVMTGAIGLAALNLRAMNAQRPALYDPDASDAQLAEARERFESLHQKSERYVGTAWFAGLTALLVTPWCSPMSRR